MSNLGKRSAILVVNSYDNILRTIKYIEFVYSFICIVILFESIKNM